MSQNNYKLPRFESIPQGRIFFADLSAGIVRCLRWKASFDGVTRLVFSGYGMKRRELEVAYPSLVYLHVHLVVGAWAGEWKVFSARQMKFRALQLRKNRDRGCPRVPTVPAAAVAASGFIR